MEVVASSAREVGAGMRFALASALAVSERRPQPMEMEGLGWEEARAAF